MYSSNKENTGYANPTGQAVPGANRDTRSTTQKIKQKIPGTNEYKAAASTEYNPAGTGISGQPGLSQGVQPGNAGYEGRSTGRKIKENIPGTEAHRQATAAEVHGYNQGAAPGTGVGGLAGQSGYDQGMTGAGQTGYNQGLTGTGQTGYNQGMTGVGQTGYDQGLTGTGTAGTRTTGQKIKQKIPGTDQYRSAAAADYDPESLGVAGQPGGTNVDNRSTGRKIKENIPGTEAHRQATAAEVHGYNQGVAPGTTNLSGTGQTGYNQGMTGTGQTGHTSHNQGLDPTTGRDSRSTTEKIKDKARSLHDKILGGGPAENTRQQAAATQRPVDPVHAKNIDRQQNLRTAVPEE